MRYAWEPLASLLDDPSLDRLLRAHHELAEPHKDICPFNPDWPAFLRLAEAGMYRVWTARDGPNLVGYFSLYVMPHMHSGVLHATGDLLTLDPDYRGHLYAMLVRLLPALRELGVKRALFGDRPPGHLAKVYKRLGFSDMEHVYAKVL